MKNGDIEMNKNGKKWIWINGAFYIDDITLNEAREIILTMNKDDFKILSEIGNILK
ncbi:MAG: hypothetical protein PHE25_06475 [Candidatus Gracilibacteria bacterium]|nr:hypothetical protein [Candidatus Gracilibacteria bacterium]